MAAFCTFSWWWLVPLGFMTLFFAACIFMAIRGGACACMPHKSDRG